MDMAGHYDVLADAVRDDIADDFGAIGIALTSMIIENISLPKEIEQAIDAAAAQSARGVDNTTGWEAMQGMRDMARNSHKGGSAGGVMGAGMGMGMGMGMGNMRGHMRGAEGPPPGYPPPGYHRRAIHRSRAIRPRGTRRRHTRLLLRRPLLPLPPRAPCKISCSSSKVPSMSACSLKRSTTRKRARSSRTSDDRGTCQSTHNRRHATAPWRIWCVLKDALVESVLRARRESNASSS